MCCFIHTYKPCVIYFCQFFFPNCVILMQIREIPIQRCEVFNSAKIADYPADPMCLI